MNITQVLNDSIMQSMLLSPLMGVIFAAIFSGLSKPPVANNATTVIVTKHIYEKRVLESTGNTSRSSDDDKAIIGLAAVILCFCLWKYATMYDQVLQWLSIAILTTLSFTSTTIIVSLIKGQYTSKDWWFYTLAPMSYLLVCLALVQYASKVFDPVFQQLAIENNVIEFYFQKLSRFGQTSLTAHVLGICCLVLTLILTALIQTHYLSLLNIRGAGKSAFFWQWLAQLTIAFSKKGWVVFATVLLVLAYIGLNPSLGAMWLMPSS